MKLLKILGIIGIVVITHFSTAFGQSNSGSTPKPEITATVIGADTVFVMNRAYAELVAERFDSLASLKQSFSECNAVVDGLQSSILERGRLIAEQNNLIGNLHADIVNRDLQYQSCERSLNVYKDVEKQLKKETRRRKTWQAVAGVGVGAAVVSSIILILQK